VRQRLSESEAWIEDDMVVGYSCGMACLDA
jgi:hypothetical protein